MKTFSYLLLLLLFTLQLSAQTIPAAQSLPYSQDFAGLAAASTVYPAGWQGWQLSATGPTTSFRTTGATADLALQGSSTALTTAGGVHNYGGKLGILASGTSDPALGLVVNTSGKINILVTFDISTLRNTFNGTTETRRNNVELQYRIGNTNGTFTSLTGTIYRNNTTAQTSGTTPRNGIRYQYILPVACENQAAVQLRWVQRDSVGTGSRPSFTIDNVIVCPAPVINAVVSPACGGYQGSIQLNVSAGTAPYTYAWDTINKNGPQFSVTAVNKTSQHPYFGVGFTLGFALDGIEGKELFLTRGINYTFLGTFPGHPFHITTSTAGASFAGEIFSGITNSQLQGGAMVFTPNTSHAALYYYQCGVHLNMGWKVNISNGQVTTPTISGLSAGSYAVAVKSADGSIATATIAVGNGTPVTLDLSSNSPLCEGSELTIDASGASSYSWTGPGGFTSNSAFNSIADVTESQAGFYYLTGTNNTGCTGTDSIRVIVNVVPAILDIIPDTAAIGQTVDVIGTGFDEVTTVSLNGSGATATVLNSNQITFEVPAGTMTGPITLSTANECSGTSSFPLVILSITNLNLKCFIEGLYTGTQNMINVLQDPLHPDYSDSVTVELFSPGNLTGPPAYSSSGVINISGNGTFSFPGSVTGQQFYIVLRHRNSIETWSKTPVTFSSGTSFDFSN